MKRPTILIMLAVIAVLITINYYYTHDLLTLIIALILCIAVLLLSRFGYKEESEEEKIDMFLRGGT